MAFKCHLRIVSLSQINVITEKAVHEGRNVKRIREILGVKQDALAIELGISQQAISALEQKEALDRDMLDKIAKVLKVPADAIRNFTDDAAVNFINNTYNDHAASYGNYYNFNPIEKFIESLEDNKKLYERLLQTEREKVALLERMLGK